MDFYICIKIGQKKFFVYAGIQAFVEGLEYRLITIQIEH